MRSSPVPLVIGITVGLVLLAGAGFAIYWLGFRGTSTAQIAKLKNDNIDNLSIDELQDRSFDMMNAMLDVFESIHSRADFEAAQTKMQDIEQAFERVSIKLAEKVSNLSPEESQAHRQRAMQRSLPKVTAFVQRSQSIVTRLKANPELHQTLTRFTLYNNGSNLINPARRDSFARNSNKSVVEKNDYVPPEYARKGKYLNEAVDKMKAVVFNLHGVGTPERLLQFIDKLETYKKDVEQLFRESNSNNFHFDNTYIPNYNGLQSHCIVMQLEVKRLGESLVQKDDLRQVLTENADRIKNCSLDKEIYQPLMIILPTPETFVEFKYEPSASGNRRASSRRGNPFENENKDYRTMPAMELIDWLKTAPSYKKSEVLKTMLLEPIDPDNRKLYLHVCGMFMDDPDMQHNKDDVFKLFRKWANTQGDKEKFGKHAEELLKHHSTRDTAMRWFGENKVISASKEVALYLKESRFDKNDAADALIAMGSGAEPAVIPYLNALEPKTRHLAIEILARIGTRECMPALRKLLNDNNNSLAAKQALVIIDKRHPEK